MSTVAPPTRREDPSNRWPWVALLLGLLVVAVAVFFFVFNRPGGVNINIEGTPTVNPVARASTASPGPPPTLVLPTLPASATLAPAPTPVPAPTKPAAPTTQPATVVVATHAPTQAAPQTPPPPSPLATQPAPPSPAPPFVGQVANTGGLGNTRTDMDGAYGSPVGETPEHLVVYRKNNFEFHARFVPDLNGRAALVVEMPQASSQPLPLEQAQAEARKLLPKDAQPPNPTPEGNQQFVVERYTSQTLAQALPPEAFAPGNGQPGQLMIVYVKDAQGRITRWIVGPGNDPNALINEGR